MLLCVNSVTGVRVVSREEGWVVCRCARYHVSCRLMAFVRFRDHVFTTTGGVGVIFVGSDVSFKGVRVPELFEGLLVPAMLKVIFSTIFMVASNVFINGNVNDSTLTTIGVATPLFVVAANVKLVFKINTSIMTSVRLSRNGQGITDVGVARTLTFSTLLVLILSSFYYCFTRPVNQLLNDSRQLLPLIIRCVG